MKRLSWVGFHLQGIFPERAHGFPVCSKQHLQWGKDLCRLLLTFVKDTCSAFLEIYKLDSFFGEVTNIGMNSEVSIGKLAKEIMKIMEVDLSIVSDQDRIRPENSEVERLVCNNEKLVNGSSWQPKYDLKRGLLKTINWFQENNQSPKAELYHI